MTSREEQDNVISFPLFVPKPSCLDCSHAAVGAVTYCARYREETDPSEASNCPDFDRLF